MKFFIYFLLILMAGYAGASSIPNTEIWTNVGITEFMTSNQGTVKDVDGDYSPWIELWNPTTNRLSLSNWSLSVDTNNLRQWIFPNVTINPQSFIVVFASAKDRRVATNELHTNFRLSLTNSFIALVNPSLNIISAFIDYPTQTNDISYGRDMAQQNATGFYSVPTPADVNDVSGAYSGPAVTFSRSGTAISASFDLSLTSASNAVIHYTMNGSVPTEASPTLVTNLTINSSVQIRARAFVNGLLPGPLHTESYLMLDSALKSTKSTLPAIVLYNFGAGAIPGENNQLVNLSIYEPLDGFTQLTNLPTLSVRAGIHLHGSTSQVIAKKAFSLEFWDEINSDTDQKPLGMPAESDFILYAPDNFEPVLIHNPLAYQLSNDAGDYAPRTRFVEVYVNTSGGNLSGANYNGIYVLEEKIKWGKNRVNIQKIRSVDELHAQDNSGTNLTGGYMMKIDRLGTGETGFSVAGQTVVYDRPDEFDLTTPQRAPQRQYLINYMNSFITALNSADYTNLGGGFRAYVDVPTWIDSHIINTYLLNVDMLRLSAYFHKDRNGKLQYGPVWDFDRSQGSTDGRDFNPLQWHASAGTDEFNFSWWGRMFTDVEFWQAWVDRYQDLRETVLSTNHVYALIDTMSAIVSPQQGREVSRWPTITAPRSINFSSNGYSFSFPGTYAGEVAFLKKWHADRLNFMDTNFMAKPVLSRTNYFLPGDTLTLTSPNGGLIFYTTNGDDPRVYGGNLSTSARVYISPIPLNSNLVVRARAYNSSHHNLTGAGNPPISTSWSGVRESTFQSAAPPIILQSPTDIDAYIGQSPLFGVTASGNPPPAYQWRLEGADLTGETSSNLLVAITNASQMGVYTVVVSNTVGSTNASFFLNVTMKPVLVVTEAMSSESKGSINSTLDHQDWWELSNLGDFPVNLKGYRFNDDHATLATAILLTNQTVIAPGESIVLVNGMTAAQFKNWWGISNLPVGLQIINYPSIGFGSDSDAIFLWNAAANSDADNVAQAVFGSSVRGVTFNYDPDTHVFGALSVSGKNGVFSAASNDDLGSPGTVITLPVLSEVKVNAINGFVFTLRTQPNRHYEIQYREDLKTGDWLVLTNFTSATNEIIISDHELQNRSGRYYRAVIDN